MRAYRREQQATRCCSTNNAARRADVLRMYASPARTPSSRIPVRSSVRLLAAPPCILSLRQNAGASSEATLKSGVTRHTDTYRSVSPEKSVELGIRPAAIAAPSGTLPSGS